MVKRDGFYKRGRFWTCSTDPITGREKSTGCTDLMAAKLWKAERERQKHNPAYARSTTATFGEWVKKVIAHKAVKLKPISLRLYPQYYGHWARIVPSTTVLAEIDAGTFDEFILLRRTDGVEDSTIGRELTAMTTLLRLAKRAGCYPGDLESLRPVDFDGAGRQGERMLAPEEFLAMVPMLNPHQLAFVCVAIALGCRRSEVFRVQEITDDATSVYIAGTKTDEARRTVPILSVFRPLLTAVQRNIPVPMTVEHNIGRSLWDACDAAGIPRCCPNDLRRTHASWLKEADVDSDVVRRLMGHKNSDLVNTVYGRPRVEKLAASAERSISNSPNLHDITTMPPPRKANSPRNPARLNAPRALLTPEPIRSDIGSERENTVVEAVNNADLRRDQASADTTTRQSAEDEYSASDFADALAELLGATPLGVRPTIGRVFRDVQPVPAQHKSKKGQRDVG